MLAINGTYQNNGIAGQTIEALIQAIDTAGGKVEVFNHVNILLDFALIAEEAHRNLERIPVVVLQRCYRCGVTH